MNATNTLDTIHLSDDGWQKGDAHIVCTKEWTQIDWTQPPNLPENVWLAFNGMLFSFYRENANCEECLAT